MDKDVLEMKALKYIEELEALAAAARIYVRIKSLYEDYFNTDQDASVFGEEFYFAVGEILAGKRIEDLNLKFLTDHAREEDKKTIDSIAQKWTDTAEKKE